MNIINIFMNMHILICKLYIQNILFYLYLQVTANKNNARLKCKFYENTFSTDLSCICLKKMKLKASNVSCTAKTRDDCILGLFTRHLSIDCPTLALYFNKFISLWLLVLLTDLTPYHQRRAVNNINSN